MATAEPGFQETGGNTSCVEVRAGAETLILDAGTGLVPLSRVWGNRHSATFLLSHLHWDHIQGFPFFRPLYRDDNTFVVYGPGATRASLTRQMEPPNFPVPLATMASEIEFRPLQPGDEFQVGRAYIRTAALNHPQGCLGYRLTVGQSTVAYATDTEHLDAERDDPEVLDIARGADLLIHDAQYTDAEYDGYSSSPRKGWGHATISAACRIARAAGVKQLALFHHDPSHDDRIIERIVAEARKLFPNVIAAREGMAIAVSASAPRASGVLNTPGPSLESWDPSGYVT